MAMRIAWQRCSARELEQAITQNLSLQGLIDDCQAIYIWRRCLTPPVALLDNPASLCRWIELMTSKPFGLIENKVLTQFATLKNLALGGSGLSSDKVDSLKRYVAKPAGRRFFANFIRELSPFCPPIYVGETNNVRRRVQEHILGLTDLKETVEQKLSLTWTDLDFYYLGLGTLEAEGSDSLTKKELRTLLEMITSQMIFAACVKRSG
jgi:hypothetical protein